MATLVATTLATRSGGSITFNPRGADSGVGRLSVDGTFQNQTPSLTMSTKRTRGGRRVTQVRFAAPQVDVTDVNNPILINSAFVDVIVTVPDGYPTSKVNDLVGWVEKGTAAAITNLNSVLVNGEGVW